MPRPEPAHGVSTPSASCAFPAASRASRSCRVEPLERPQNRPGLFHPGNAPELSPSGLCSLRRSRLVSEPDPPMLLSYRRGDNLQLRRLTPSGEAAQPDRSQTTRSALMAFSPLRLSLSPPWSRLPDSSSHVLPPDPLPRRLPDPTESLEAHHRVLPCGEPVSHLDPQANPSRTGPSGVSHLVVPCVNVPTPRRTPDRTHKPAR
jgi:hypothetical protein